MPRLELLDYCHIDAIKTYLDAIKQAGEVLYGTGMLARYEDDLEEYIRVEKQMHLGIYDDPNLVPGTTLVYIEEDVILGFVNIRHCLNDFLLKQGGHIGYSVHPNYRRLGHASKMLELAVSYCKQKGIYPVLVTCDKENIGSKSVIEKNQGILETEGVTLRYWIGEKR